MKQILFLFLLISTSCFSQELKLISATKQTIISDTSVAFTIKYVIRIDKSENFKWSIDSVINVLSGKKIAYHIVKVCVQKTGLTVFKKVKSFSKKDKRLYEVIFSTSITPTKVVHPGSPVNMQTPELEFSQGAIVYYSCNRKTKTLKVDTFTE